jgi:hypothetical protein
MKPTIDYTSVFDEKIFTFLVGPTKQEFQVHPGVLSSISAPMQALMANGMKESNDRQAKLPETDPETFRLFLEYAYTGAYQAGPPLDLSIKLPDHQKDICYCIYCGCKVNKKTREQVCLRLYCRALYVRKLPYAQFCGICSERQGRCEEFEECSNFDYGPSPVNDAFLKQVYKVNGSVLSTTNAGITGRVSQHVKLYHLSDQYMVEGLRQLSLVRLHQGLCLLCVNETTISEVCALIKYVGDNVLSVGIDPNDLLQDLVLEYMAFDARTLFEYEGFRELLVTGGLFLSAFAVRTVNNLDREMHRLAIANQERRIK